VTFQPILPSSGYVGWAFLKRTMTSQSTSFAAQSSMRAEEDYFRDKIGKISTAADLVADRRLLKVTLEAFGLEGDLNSRYFIRKVLEDGTLKTGALANSLADKQYAKLSAAFGFGDYDTPRTKLSDFADKIIASWKDRRFESAVGEQNNDLRLALNTRRELASVAGSGGSEVTKWYRIIGNTPLRTVFQTALGLPTTFGKLGVDQQVSILQNKASAAFGATSVSQFTDPDKVETLIRRYLARGEANAVAATTGRGVTALAMLQQTNALMRRL
jgi:hypothetical protein